MHNAEYTNEYFAIMDGLDGDIAGRRDAFAYLKGSTAIVHHRVVDFSFVPRLYDRKTYDTFKYIAETAHGILCKVIDRYLNDPAYRTVFSFDERLQELILLPSGYETLLPFARVDIFFNEDAHTAKFCEFNADGSSGMNENREITNAIRDSQTFRTFSRFHGVEECELFESWVDEFLALYATYEGAVVNPQVAICDFLENAVVDEFKVFTDVFKSRGVDCSICDVRALRFDGERLTDADGRRIDAIWRRCVTNDIMEFWDGSQALIEAVRARKVALIGGFSGHIVHDKQIFSVLSHPATKAFLSEEEAAFIDNHIPFTTFLDADHIDLGRVRADKDAWIIKPTDHYGADNVYAGSFWSQEEWDGLIDRFANGASGMPFLVQEYCRPFKTLVLRPDTDIENLADEQVSREGVPYNNIQGLYLYNGTFTGVFSRLGPLPTISKDMQGITSATIWVDR